MSGDPAVSQRDAEERRRACRALLVRPLLRARSDEALFRLARRHADDLRSWFFRETGWRLICDAETVRLLKSYVPHGTVAEGIDATYPARARRDDPAFTRRRYVLLCLTLAALERSDAQVTLGRLAESVVLEARQPGLEDVSFTLAGREERADVVAVIRLLLDYGVLRRVAGDEETYVISGGDALYDVDRRVLATMLASPHSPSMVCVQLGDAPSVGAIEAALHAQPVAYTEDEGNRRLRQAVSRRLLSDPVVYYDELAEDERAYLISQRVPITRRLADATGLVPELRAEGIALVDPDDELTDLRMPEQGTQGHATLLLAEHLARVGASTIGELEALMAGLARSYQSYWRRSATEPGAERELLAEAVDRLAGLGLVRVVGSGEAATVEALPALHRFAVTGLRTGNEEE